MMTEAWNRAEFLERQQDVGSHAYHHLHPFHVRMNEGSLDRDSVRLWAANRFYYQRSIPIKDAAILSNCPLREVRRVWVQRIVDHDGKEGQEGGIEKWIRLALACGLTREETIDERHVLPGVRFAVDAYVNFAQDGAMVYCHRLIVDGAVRTGSDGQAAGRFSEILHLDCARGLDYFRARLTQAREDSEFALSATLKYCADRNMQEAAVKALRFKCDVLWTMLDALTVAL